jgi:hypothetical protein
MRRDSYSLYAHTGTWTQILTKKILNNSDQTVAGGKDYRWYEMAFFTRWTDAGVNQILCIDTPPTLREELTKVLAASPTLELQDPFAMFRPLLDEVLKLCDENTWRVAKEVRRIEKVRNLQTPPVRTEVNPIVEEKREARL